MKYLVVSSLEFKKYIQEKWVQSSMKSKKYLTPLTELTSEDPQRFECANSNGFCETKVWLFSILMITKWGLELMIIFQVWLGKKIFKVAITKIKSS